MESVCLATGAEQKNIGLSFVDESTGTQPKERSHIETLSKDVIID